MTVNADAAHWLALCKWLEDGQDMKDLIATVTQRDAQLLMTRDMDDQVPEHIKHATSTSNRISTPSGDAGDLTRRIVSQMNGYPTKVRLHVKGTATQAKGDKLEKHLAVKLGHLNEGKRLTSGFRKRQVGTGWQVVVYRYGPNNECKAEAVDVYSVAFPPVEAPCRLPVYSLRFTKLMRDAVKEYGKEANGSANEYIRGKTLTRSKKGDKGWEWLWTAGVSRDIATDGQGDNSGSALTSFEDEYTACPFVYVNDGETEAIVALQSDKDTKGQERGEVVWARPCLTKGTNAVLVPGVTFPSTKMAHHLQPMLWAYMQDCLMLDFWVLILTYNAMDRKPDIIFTQDPQMGEMAEKQGIITPVVEETGDGSRQLLKLPGGRVVLWNQQEVPYVEAMIEKYQASKDKKESAHMATLTAEVLESSTLGAVQLALGQRSIEQADPLANGDWGLRELLLMSIEVDVAYLKGPDGKQATGKQAIVNYARGGEAYGSGELDSGYKVEMTLDDFLHEGSTDWFTLEVITVGMNAQEQTLRAQEEAQLKAIGASTMPRVWEARGVDDLTSFASELMKDEMREASGPLQIATVPMAFQERMRLRYGVDWTRLTLATQAQQTLVPAGPSGSPRPAPAVPSAMGGSGTQVQVA